MSEDGTLMQKPDGTAEHGRTTSDGYFQTERTVDGQTMWGSDIKDGWISQDSTVYIPTGGAPEHGISTPDGRFAQNGVTKTLGNGQVLYGHQMGGDFLSADGKTAVLANGTVLQGSYDDKTGVFTSSTGATYVVTDNGITPAAMQSDGSYLLGNGQTVMTPRSWAVDVPAFHDAMVYVKQQAYAVRDEIDSLSEEYSNIEFVWTGPAGTTFADLATRVDDAAMKLQHLPDDIIRRMEQSYDKYVQAEKDIIQNLQGY
ncbi:hypothetical protein [Streptomyces sp. NPDC052036]|uniref:WXG100 family type VII secretion target n=1 Tax=Streptomyces sp. NPDC052036 TaxID=3155171 RepID=UPI0034388615